MSIPPEPPPHPDDCTCGPWTWTGKHWVFTVDPACPLHRAD